MIALHTYDNDDDDDGDDYMDWDWDVCTDDCPEGEYDCDDATCISSSLVCNGVRSEFQLSLKCKSHNITYVDLP